MEIIVNKEVDLANNDGLSVINNHAAQQHHNALSVFYDFISNIQPSTILEIGTALGGFTALLGCCKKDLNLDCKIISYDIIKHHWYDQLIDYGVVSRTHNIFSSNYDSLVDESIIELIKSNGQTIILCDGGCKKCEFNILSRHMKLNDIIMTHDYAPNKDYFVQNMNLKKWNWHEIEDSDIFLSIEENNLVKYENWYDKFLSVAWGCFIRNRL
jgi:cephalosporin hydroxylase